MKANKSLITVAILLTAGLSSCTYDYEMPSYSNTHVSYRVGELPKDIREKWINEAEDYGLNVSFAEEKWEYVVQEQNDSGEILYMGSPRGNGEGEWTVVGKGDPFKVVKSPDANASLLKIGYICKGRIDVSDYNYYNLCTFWVDKTFPLNISPVVPEYSAVANDKYTLVPVSSAERVYMYKIKQDESVNQLVENTLQPIGYDFDETTLTVVEKDENGEVIYQGEQKVSGCSSRGAKTVEAFIDVYGRPLKTTMPASKLATISFSPVTLGPKDIVLKSEMSQSVEVIPVEKRSIPYYINSQLSGIQSQLMNETADKMGYESNEISGIVVVEKNKEGKKLASKSITKSGDLQNSEIGTKTIEATIMFTAGKIMFSPVEIEVNKTYSLSDIAYTMETNSVPYSVGYESSVTMLMIDTLETLGYNISKTRITIKEHDINGNEINSAELSRNTYDRRSSVVNARSITVIIDSYGWPKGSYRNEAKIATITFGPLNLEVGKKYELTTDMEYLIEIHK